MVLPQGKLTGDGGDLLPPKKPVAPEKGLECRTSNGAEICTIMYVDVIRLLSSLCKKDVRAGVICRNMHPSVARYSQ